MYVLQLWTVALFELAAPSCASDLIRVSENRDRLRVVHFLRFSLKNRCLSKWRSGDTKEM
jgi:hypothetical protein